MTDSDDQQEAAFADLPLRERVPDYLAMFGAGLAAALVLAFAATLFGLTFLGSLTNILIAYTVLLFLAGGTTGGGYANLGLGGVAAVTSRGRRETLDDRLQRGLRPERNPRAFWQVVAGTAYLAIAVLVIVLT
jgi:hypothetical protein